MPSTSGIALQLSNSSIKFLMGTHFCLALLILNKDSCRKTLKTVTCLSGQPKYVSYNTDSPYVAY